MLRAVDCRLCQGGGYIVSERIKGALGFSHIPTRISTMGMARPSKLEETLGGLCKPAAGELAVGEDKKRWRENDKRREGQFRLARWMIATLSEIRDALGGGFGYVAARSSGRSLGREVLSAMSIST